jgi:FlaA1/EpsC-like NDP-sugar epimerase
MGKIYEGRSILITGGTGSLGGAILSDILSRRNGNPRFVRVLSRDESKQYSLTAKIKQMHGTTRGFECVVGDVRDYRSVEKAMRGMDIVIHTAAMKHVPACEQNVEEAVWTNIIGSENIVRATRDHGSSVTKVIAISTDKACAPMSAMGMTKALMERVFKNASQRYIDPSFICVRMGNMLMSRGSVVPLFRKQIEDGGPVTVTHPDMTRFFIPLGTVVDHIVYALSKAKSGEIYVPRMRSVNIENLAKTMMGLKRIPIEYSGIRQGEKIHDVLINKHESRYAKNDSHTGWFIDMSAPLAFNPEFEEWSYHSGQPENFMPLLDLEDLLRQLEGK